MRKVSIHDPMTAPRQPFLTPRKTLWVVALAFLSLIVGCSRLGFGPPDIETRPAQYASLLAQWQEQGLTEHFPKAIPAEATATKLSAFPGFMQGGGWFQVRLTLPPATVAAIFDHATQQAKAFYDGGGFFKLANEEKNGLPGTDFHTADPPLPAGGDFPTDYRIFIYDARPYRPGESFQWNHGQSRGVVISQTRHEVIYFAESW